MTTTAALVFLSVLFPMKTWFAPDQAVTITVKPESAVTLVLTDFAGVQLESTGSTEISEEKTIAIKDLFPQTAATGTYVLYAVPKGKTLPDFVGTPLVIGVRHDTRRNAPPAPTVTKVEPLRYAVIDTDKGKMTAVFYYDVAPNTVANFQTLAEGGYYDGLVFHRIIRDFVIQAGDPLGTDPDPNRVGTGSPGYSITAEFNDRPHTEGVLSMARSGDPNERMGMMPRAEFANSAGSQFFVCLNYQPKPGPGEQPGPGTASLDGKYTAFGKVIEGFEVAKEIEKSPTDPQNDRPTTPQVIKSIKILPVTPDSNPYAKLKLETIQEKKE